MGPNEPRGRRQPRGSGRLHFADQVGLILLVIFAIVIATEFVTSYIRGKII